MDKINFGITSIAFVLLVSGCVGQNAGPTQTDIADVLIATNQPVIPSQPTAGSSFTVRLAVENQHGTEFADGVEAYLFDSGKCKVSSVNDKSKSPDKDGKYALLENQPLRFAPGQQELVKIVFDAPPANQIVGLSATCPVRYKVAYDFAAKSEMSLDVLNEKRLEQIEAEKGERPTSERTLNIGPGPIRISVEPRTALPVVTDRKMQIEVFVKNIGNGNLKDGIIQMDNLELTIPKDISVDKEPEGADDTLCNGKFHKPVATDKGITYTNTENIQFVKGQTNPITCYLLAPSKETVSTQRQYTIIASIGKYKYEYFGKQIDVTIKP